MSLPVPPLPGVLIVAVILSPAVGVSEVEAALAAEFGPIAQSLPFTPYVETKYYEREMGAGLARGFYAFEKPCDPEELAQIKLATNALEAKFSTESGRRVNLDPGFLDLGKLALPSCKDAAHRVYLGKGVHVEIEYRFIAGTFQPLEWTYPDYKNPRVIEWFNSLREGLRKARKAVPQDGGAV